MTREEAIEELKTRHLTMSQCLDKEELHKANEALEMAIKALEQEPKPMVEIDLYSVIKQKYIEREVLDKIDEIITDALDKSTDQKESQTLRWVLDKISEVT